MPLASVNILVGEEKESNEIKNKIENGEDFMVPEFDKIVFSEEVGKLHGPIKTQFGYHHIEIITRS
tara:strand:- start:318 stop:515 length:198 start_codon:yes stop_codon:yes gene_type:complete